MNNCFPKLDLTGVNTDDPHGSHTQSLTWESNAVNRAEYRVWKQYRTLIEVSRRIEEENYDPCIEEAHK
jgi:hypothetical protein